MVLRSALTDAAPVAVGVPVPLVAAEGAALLEPAAVAESTKEGMAVADGAPPEPVAGCEAAAVGEKAAEDVSEACSSGVPVGRSERRAEPVGESVVRASVALLAGLTEAGGVQLGAGVVENCAEVLALPVAEGGGVPVGAAGVGLVEPLRVGGGVCVARAVVDAAPVAVASGVGEERAVMRGALVAEGSKAVREASCERVAARGDGVSPPPGEAVTRPVAEPLPLGDFEGGTLREAEGEPLGEAVASALRIALPEAREEREALAAPLPLRLAP